MRPPAGRFKRFPIFTDTEEVVWNRIPLSPTFTEPLMSDARPADQPKHDAFRARLEEWLNQQNQVLLEEVIATWQSSLGHFRPSDALLDQFLEAAAVPSAPAPSGRQDIELASALDLLEGATSQSDLLKRLLDALSLLAERSGLFILKQGLASVYAHRGFEADAPSRAGAVVPPPELEAMIQGLTRSIRRKGPGYTALITPISSFEASEVAIFALRHKKRAVALVLVDSGLRQSLDHPEQVARPGARRIGHAGLTGQRQGRGFRIPPRAGGPSQRPDSGRPGTHRTGPYRRARCKDPRRS